MEQIGRYRIDGVLGVGAMGTVYKAFDSRIERTVALKTIRKDLLLGKFGDEVRSRFRTEARAAGRLVHPNIVTIYDFDEDEGTAYIAMEYVPGRGLDAIAGERGPLPPHAVMHWAGQLLDALHYAHSHGIAHRDIKPGNLLVTEDNQLKVADFGIAKIFSAQASPSEYLAGTPEYMSPEQFLGVPIDGRSDIFSSGIVLYQLLTGVKPFTGPMAAVMRKIMHEHPVPPSVLRPELPPAFDAVIQKALQKEASERYPSARDFAAALIQASGAQAGSHPPPGVRPASPDEASDQTVVAKPDGGDPFNGAFRAPAQALVPGQGGPGQAAPAASMEGRWGADFLRHLETHFAYAVGPMARVLLKKEVSSADNENALVQALLRHIPTEAGRTRFLAAARSAPRDPAPVDPVVSRAEATAPSAPSHAETQSEPMQRELDAELLNAAEQALLRYIGPLARLLVKRTARQTGNPREFCALLAQHIPDAASRDRFLQELGIE